MYTNKIREIRRKKGYTLEYVSTVAGISIGYLCHLEKGTRNNPSAQIMAKIAEALEESVSSVFFVKKQ